VGFPINATPQETAAQGRLNNGRPSTGIPNPNAGAPLTPPPPAAAAPPANQSNPAPPITPARP
jgi:hypothetical protein